MIATVLVHFQDTLVAECEVFLSRLVRMLRVDNPAWLYGAVLEVGCIQCYCCSRLLVIIDTALLLLLLLLLLLVDHIGIPFNFPTIGVALQHLRPIRCSTEPRVKWIDVPEYHTSTGIAY
jgi:hypothetical protein